MEFLCSSCYKNLSDSYAFLFSFIDQFNMLFFISSSTIRVNDSSTIFYKWSVDIIGMFESISTSEFTAASAHHLRVLLYSVFALNLKNNHSYDFIH